MFKLLFLASAVHAAFNDQAQKPLKESSPGHVFPLTVSIVVASMKMHTYHSRSSILICNTLFLSFLPRPPSNACKTLAPTIRYIRTISSRSRSHLIRNSKAPLHSTTTTNSTSHLLLFGYRVTRRSSSTTLVSGKVA
jgi:hypothetical protein